MEDQESIGEILNLATSYYHRQWMFATAGNLSFRSQKPNQFWITASGKNKGKLKESDFVCVGIQNSELIKNSFTLDTPSNKPSAETSIHRSIYKFFENVNSVLHVHTLSSNLLNFGISRTEGHRLVPIPNIEIIKAFGIWEEKPNLSMAVVYNFGNVHEIAEQVSFFLDKNPKYELPFILVEEHGPTVWGNSIDEANRHLEATAFLLDVMQKQSK